ncbi:MAG TPA: hypothetical protein VHO91_21675 [Rhodopila sp.]|nr:hypothetical protein [Rhodopila sp.]
MPDPLQRLLKLRRQAVEQGRLALAICLRAEADAAADIAVIDARLHRDRLAAAELTESDPRLAPVAREGQALARSQRETAGTVHAAAAARSATARQHLTWLRARAEAVGTLLAERAAQAERLAERQAENALDDVVRSRLVQNRPDRQR